MNLGWRSVRLTSTPTPNPALQRTPATGRASCPVDAQSIRSSTTSRFVWLIDKEDWPASAIRVGDLRVAVEVFQQSWGRFVSRYGVVGGWDTGRIMGVGPEGGLGTDRGGVDADAVGRVPDPVFGAGDLPGDLGGQPGAREGTGTTGGSAEPGGRQGRGDAEPRGDQSATAHQGIAGSYTSPEPGGTSAVGRADDEPAGSRPGVTVRKAGPTAPPTRLDAPGKGHRIRPASRPRRATAATPASARHDPGRALRHLRGRRRRISAVDPRGR